MTSLSRALTIRLTLLGTVLFVAFIAAVLAFVTQFMTLEPGDLVLTGTPAGVGAVQPGDSMTVEVEGLGLLSNPVIAENAGSAA